MNRAKLQAFGGPLTAIVIPDMDAFTTWGFITAPFIPAEWISDGGFNELVTPMVKYILSVILTYFGGRLVYGGRRAIAGCVGTFGLIVGSEVNMFLGAMIMGPPSTWCVKQFGRLVDGRIPAGFEMVANSFPLGTIVMILSLYSYAVIGPVTEFVNEMITSMITSFARAGLLPLSSVVNKFAKVLFLNSVADRGVYYPLRMQQAAEAGEPIFFVVASNPGVGFGLLLAFPFFGKGSSKKTAPGVITTHFLDGIHEVHFPCMPMKPLMIFPMIIGFTYGIMVFGFLGTGLVAGPSPGSIFAYLALAPRGSFIGILAGVVTATVVSFPLTSPISKTSKDSGDKKLEKSVEKSKAMKQEGKDFLTSSLQTEVEALKDIAHIAPTCDAGLESSALGAIAFKKCLQKIGVEKTIRNYAIERMPDKAGVIVTHISLLDRVRLKFPNRRIITIQNSMNNPNLNALFEEINNTESWRREEYHVNKSYRIMQKEYHTS